MYVRGAGGGGGGGGGGGAGASAGGSGSSAAAGATSGDASAPRRHRTLAVVAPRRCSCPKPMRRLRIRTRRRCGRPAGSAVRPWRPSYRCARSAYPTCRARRCRPSAPRDAAASWPLVPVAQTASPCAPSTRLPSSCRVSVYAPFFDVSDCPRSSFSPMASLSVTIYVPFSRRHPFVDRRGRLVPQTRRG